jgi:N6-L-threonylcarbamoyladenine synthase
VVKDGRVVLSNVVSSQVDLHAVFGGVVPEVAARRHIECVGAVVDRALQEAGLDLAAVDGFAVANGPGLAGALLVGLSYAKALAYSQKKACVGVHHIEGHICANYLTDGENNGEAAWQPPFLCLVVSGGHTSLIAVRDYEVYEVLGRTRDDAAGEAFDKTARVLGLPYPGGPEIDKLAQRGSPVAVAFPRGKVGADEALDFTFSGLKSAVIQYLAKPNPAPVADVAASFQQAVMDVLVGHTMKAARQFAFDKIALAGGVACNQGLRQAMKDACAAHGYTLRIPPPVYCTDNAAMVAGRGYYALKAGKADGYGLNVFSQRWV